MVWGREWKMKVKCTSCGNMHPKDYCSLVNPFDDSSPYIDSLIRKAKLNVKKGKRTYICDMCAS